jgi:RNA polymerase sigma-70 factor (ECF subfamily)
MVSMHMLGDTLLMERIAAGDTLAFEVLYTRHSSVVYGYAFRILKDHEAAADITQETYLALWRRASTYDAARSSVRSWLLSIAHHRAIDHVRSSRRRAESPEWVEALEELTLDGDDTQQEVFSRLESQQVRQALGCLPSQERRCVLLIYFAGLTYREAAELLGLPPGTVKSRIRLALGRLRRHLGQSPAWDDEAQRGA